MLCGEGTLVKNERHQITLSPLPCKCWYCDECRPGRTARLAAEAKAGNPDLFITLTSRRRPDLTPDQAAHFMVIAWRDVRRAYVAEHGPGSLPFLAVFERTKKGWPHIHIVARCKWLDQKWLSDQMRRLIGSPVVDVRRVYGTRKVAAYITKYLAKNPERFDGCKRYWRSLDYLEPEAQAALDPDEPLVTWEKLDTPWQETAAAFERAGFAVAYSRDHALVRLRGPP